MQLTQNIFLYKMIIKCVVNIKCKLKNSTFQPAFKIKKGKSIDDTAFTVKDVLLGLHLKQYY